MMRKTLFVVASMPALLTGVVVLWSFVSPLATTIGTRTRGYQVQIGDGSLSYTAWSMTPPRYTKRVRFPVWYVPILLAALPLGVGVPLLIIRRRGGPPPHGRCRKCGYNLTGLNENRCPECATEFEGPK